MSSDGYFDGDDFNDAMFEELDAIETAVLSPGRRNDQTQEHSPNYSAKPIAKDNSFYDLTLDINEFELEKLDEFIEDAYQGKAQPVAGPSKSISNTHQTTLFGNLLPTDPIKPRSQIQRTTSTTRNPFGQRPPKTKTWDQTVFAKSGLKQGKAKGKGKGKWNKTYDADDDEEENVEFEQFPAPVVTVGPPPPMKLAPDLLEAKHWIYPTNKPKRDYQFNIVKHCLFENSIVALPTGLGKTFIAGVVMLNYYRWFPEGKVVFVAPTKPLVAQQIDACHQVCGIPGRDAAELTGQIVRSLRGKLWKEKRVFYMTPQTCINDLMTDNCDPRSIILLVVDEAHRATGDYAYNQIVRFLMAKNSHFRVLALTATPGGSTEAVQNLIDGLHISHIEIRDENSLDLKAYIYRKTIKQHVITMSEDVNKVKDLLSKLMDADIKPLRQRGILHGPANPVTLHPYAAQARMSSLGKDQKWAYAPLARVSNLARAMGYLVEGTLTMCYDYMQEISQEQTDEGNTGKTASRSKKLRNDPLFQAVMREFETQRNRGFTIHPKMDRLKTLVVQHFAENLEDGQVESETRVMVFVTFRQVVDEIVEALNLEQPLIRATRFIGQGTDKQGRRGMPQKEQLEIINKFKNGEFNVMVATSIGEEGLDIGEVDLIVCYDAQKTPIRMLQRAGRTGRKRAGFVHVLLAEGREEFNLDKANDAYKEVQNTISRGEKLELYADVERLLPKHVKPQCLEKVMEIQEYTRDELKKKGKSAGTPSPTKAVKRKRNDDVARNIPTGASTGFVSVADLLVKGSKKRRKAPIQRDFELAGEDDETDKELESGLILGLPRQTDSSTASTLKRSINKSRRSKSSTIEAAKASNKNKKNKITVEPTSSQFSGKGIDDEDDEDIERGMVRVPPGTVKTHHSPIFEPLSPFLRSPPNARTPEAKELDYLVSRHADTREINNDHELASPQLDQSMAWLVDEDEDPDIIILSSPVENKQSTYKPNFGDESIEFIGSPKITKSNTSYPLQDDDNSVEIVGSSIIQPTARYNLQAPKSNVPTNATKAHTRYNTGSFSKYSPVRLSTGPGQAIARNTMPPPMSPQRISTQIALMDTTIPEPSFPVRPAIKQAKKRSTILEELESPASDIIPPPRRRLHRRTNSPIKNTVRKSRTKKNPKIGLHPNLVYDAMAVHSGDETTEGSSHSDDTESESDRLFLEEIPGTQASPSYDQTLAYRQSLFTQAPSGAKVPFFAKPPARPNTIFGYNRKSRSRPLLSSSPPRNDSEPDEYVFGSFVVDDDADISYLSDEASILTK